MTSASVKIRHISVCCDKRGWVFEPLSLSQIEHQKNAHLVITLPGQIRGNHFHRLATETVTVFGPALVRFRKANTTRDISVGKEEAIQLVFPPGVAHAIKNTGTRPGILIAFSNRPYDPQAPDTYRDILI